MYIVHLGYMNNSNAYIVIFKSYIFWNELAIFLAVNFYLIISTNVV